MGLGCATHPGVFCSHIGAPKAAVICVPLSPVMKKPQRFGWESRNLPRHMTRDPSAPQSPREHPNFCTPKGTHTPKWVQPHATPHGLGAIIGLDAPPGSILTACGPGNRCLPSPKFTPRPTPEPTPTL